MLAEHRGLAVLFLAALIAFALYCWKMPRRAAAPDATVSQAARSPASAPAQTPIYVEAVPDK
jgi:hypothetical protein